MPTAVSYNFVGQIAHVIHSARQAAMRGIRESRKRM